MNYSQVHDSGEFDDGTNFAIRLNVVTINTC